MSSVLSELGLAVRSRRTDMGLTQATLAILCGLSRATVNQVEKGTLADLSLTRSERLLNTLGLSLQISRPRSFGNKTSRISSPLEIAARTASVSYGARLTVQQLRQALMAGQMNDSVAAHVYTLLDEAPVSLLASVVEQIYQEDRIERPTTWSRMRTLARAYPSKRDIWQ